jgi:hypothetical protein
LGNAVIGGYVYRGSKLPSMYGAYLYGDNGSGRVWALVWDGTRVLSNLEIASVNRLSSFGEDEAGEVYAVSHAGRLYRFRPRGGTAPTIPLKLSQTGLFTDTARLVPDEGLIEYDVNSPLWSDGSTKRRWISLPDPDRIGFHATGNWEFPQGTVLVKHFEMALADGSTRRLETRALVRHDDGWNGYTYRWNAAQTDADLLGGAETETLTVPDGQGGQRQLEWTYPSRADCMRCHTEASGYVLGVRTHQLNGDLAYPSFTDNQLRVWNHINMFTTDIGAHTAFDALPDPADEGAPLAARARVPRGELRVLPPPGRRHAGQHGPALPHGARRHADARRRVEQPQRHPHPARRQGRERGLAAHGHGRRPAHAAAGHGAGGSGRPRRDRALDRRRGGRVASSCGCGVRTARAR